MRIATSVGALVAAVCLASARAEVERDVLAPEVRAVSIAVSSDGTRLAAMDVEGAVHVLDASDGSETCVLPDSVRNTAVSFVGPDASTIATSGKDVCVWNVAKAKVVKRIAPPAMPEKDRPSASRAASTAGFAAAASPRDRLVALAGADRRVILWNAATAREVGSIASGGVGIAAAFSGNGSKFAAVLHKPGGGRIVDVYDVAARTLAWRIDISNYQDTAADPGSMLIVWSDVAFTADGRTLVAKCGDDDYERPDDGRRSVVNDAVRAYDVAKKAVRWTRRFEDAQVRRAVPSPNGDRIAVATSRGVALLDPANGATTSMLGDRSDAPDDVAFSPDGTTLYAVTRRAGGVVRRRLEDASAVAAMSERPTELRAASWKFPVGQESLSLSSDGRTLLGRGTAGLATYDVAKGTLRRDIATDGAAVDSAAFVGAENDYVAFRRSDGSRADVCSVATGERLAVIDHRLVRPPAGPDEYRLSCVASCPRRREVAVAFAPTAGSTRKPQILFFDAARQRTTTPPQLDVPDGACPRPVIAAYSADGLQLAAVLVDAESAQLAMWRRTDLDSPWSAPTAKSTDLLGSGLRWCEAEFTPDGLVLALSADHFGGDGRAVLVLWSTIGDAAPWIGASRSGSFARGMAVSPRGDGVAIATFDGAAILDPTTGEQKLKLPGTRSISSGLAFSPDGARLYAALERDLVYWDLGPKK